MFRHSPTQISIKNIISSSTSEERLRENGHIFSLFISFTQRDERKKNASSFERIFIQTNLFWKFQFFLYFFKFQCLFPFSLMIDVGKNLRIKDGEKQNRLMEGQGLKYEPHILAFASNVTIRRLLTIFAKNLNNLNGILTLSIKHK